eukprot:8218119-Pyramimonas_sp.AAC.1
MYTPRRLVCSGATELGGGIRCTDARAASHGMGSCGVNTPSSFADQGTWWIVKALRSVPPT